MRRIVILACSAAVVLSACSGTEPPAATTITVVAPDTLRSIGGTGLMTAAVLDQHGQPFAGLTVSEWQSADPSVATVNASGIVTAVANGSTTITARAGTLSGTAPLVVRQKAFVVQVTGAQAIGSLGSTVSLTATAADALGTPITGRPFQWTSGTPAVAAVDPATGVVTAVGPGTTSIVATLDGTNGALSITVTQVPFAITLTAPTDTMRALTAIGQFAATVRDSGGTAIPGSTFTWETTNASIVSVNPTTGRAVAESNGTVYVRARSEPLVDSVKLTVKQRVKPSLSLLAVVSPLLLVGDVDRVTVTARDSLSVAMSVGGETVALSLGDGTSGGTLSAVSDNGNGTYTADFTGATIGSPRSVSATINGAGIPGASSLQVVGITKVSVWSTSGAFGNSCFIITTNDMYCLGTMWSRGHGVAAPPESELLATKVVGGHQWATMDIGFNAMCGITTAGKLYCWGEASQGGMGNGLTGGNFWSPAAIAPDSTFTSVEMSLVSGGCALTAAKNAVCWGLGVLGRLGNGGDTLSASHVAVAGGQKFDAVSTSNAGTCGVSIAASGSATMCWGYYPVLGTTAPYPHKCTSSNLDCARTPVATSGGRAYKPVIGHHGNEVCALGTDDKTYCWGLWSSTPEELTGAPTFTSIVAGDLDFCGLTTTGDVYCWGTNRNLRFGPDMNTIHRVPELLGGGHTFTQIAMTQTHACGLKSDGTAYCWGDNPHGEVGDRTTIRRPTPVRVKLFFP